MLIKFLEHQQEPHAASQLKKGLRIFLYIFFFQFQNTNTHSIERILSFTTCLRRIYFHIKKHRFRIFKLCLFQSNTLQTTWEVIYNIVLDLFITSEQPHRTKVGKLWWFFRVIKWRKTSNSAKRVSVKKESNVSFIVIFFFTISRKWWIR